jgi:hypothetical protein
MPLANNPRSTINVRLRAASHSEPEKAAATAGIEQMPKAQAAFLRALALALGAMVSGSPIIMARMAPRVIVIEPDFRPEFGLSSRIL